jgi:limonene-1,2-epoxide hydrolase
MTAALDASVPLRRSTRRIDVTIVIAVWPLLGQDRLMTSTAGDPTRFVDQFAEGWALPKPEAFFEYFAPLIAADARFRQPLFPTAVGPEGFRRTFQPLFELIPDLVANVRRWAAREEVVFIESTFVGTLDRAAAEFDVCDRFVLRDGIIAERTSYSDPTAIFGAIARHPSVWPRTVSSLLTARVRHVSTRQPPHE